MRLVSLAPNVTEILFALGMEDSLIGVTDCCDYPPEAKEIECIGGFGKPNIEKLLAIAPDMVIAVDFERKDMPDALRNAGIQVLEVKIRNIEEIFEAFRKIGEVAGNVERADQIVAGMRAELDAVAARYERLPQEKRVRVFAELWYDPVTTVGGGSFVHDVITRAGGVNVAGELPQAHPTVSPEMVVKWNPDVILICYMGTEKQGGSNLASRIGWKNIKAVREGRIITDVPLDHILRPGPRVIQGIKDLAEKLYPNDE